MSKAKASTQDHLDIEEITADLVLLKNGWVALIMATNAVNFDLLSEAEQDATIFAYGAFLNSLSFPMQVLIRSKKADITAYFQSLEEAGKTQPNPDLKRQIQKYQDFIQATVQQKTVLDKKFYLIINFSPLEAGLKIIKGAKGASPAKNKAQLVSDATIALMPKRDHIIKQTARLGLTTRQLTNQELIELFYDIYNPAPTGTQKVLLDTSAYTTPIVEPAVEIPTPAPESRLQDDQAIGLSGKKAATSSDNSSSLSPSGLSLRVEDLRAEGLMSRQLFEPEPFGSEPQGRRPQSRRPDVPTTQLRPVPPPSSQSTSTAQASALNNLRQATTQAAQMLESSGNQVTRQSGNATSPVSPNPDSPNT